MQESCAISNDITTPELREKLACMGAALVRYAMEKYFLPAKKPSLAYCQTCCCGGVRGICAHCPKSLKQNAVIKNVFHQPEETK